MRKESIVSNVNDYFLIWVMKLIGNITTVLKWTECFGILSCKFDPLCISQMSYFISLYILL